MTRVPTRPSKDQNVENQGGLPLVGFALAIALAGALPAPVAAQQPARGTNSETPSQDTIGQTSATEVHVAGAVAMNQGEMFLGNGSTITAGTQPVKVSLNRGGQILLCSTTSLHLSKDRSIAHPEDTALMMALDRGALETHYTVGKYSDVLLTPDLRILISGPGEADLSIRLNNKGDTCVDNHGANAPYVTVSSQFEGGAYRVQPNQRVTFEHGGLNEMIDREPEPCGCPPAPAVSLADAGASSKNPAHPGQAAGGSDTAFPLAESEGLAPPPAVPDKPVVPVGVAHAEVTVPLVYNGDKPATPPAQTGGKTANSSASARSSAGESRALPGNTVAQSAPSGEISSSSAVGEPTATAVPSVPSPVVPSPAAAPSAPPAGRGFFHRIGHFFGRIFGE